MEVIQESDGWIVPEHTVGWLTWGFGTRHTVLTNEPASVKQIHGADVLTVEHAGLAGIGDALVTKTPGVLLGIKTADCLPILLVDIRHRVVAAVHAGWRGTAQRIAEAALTRMNVFAGTNPSDLLVAMGPAIQKCCFEVGSEVAHEFARYDPALAGISGKCHLDLQAINAAQLIQAGVSSEKITRCEYCTVCSSKMFWSYRKEQQQAGRMWSVVRINPS